MENITTFMNISEMQQKCIFHTQLILSWHHVEITSLNDLTYILVDGAMLKINDIPLAGDSDLIFGGHCEVRFKDIEIDTMTSRDAEDCTTGRNSYFVCKPLALFGKGIR